MNNNIKKLNITSKIAPIIASGVLFLTGCGHDTVQKESVSTNEVKASSITTENVTEGANVETTTNVVTTKNDVVSTTTTGYTTLIGEAVSSVRTTTTVPATTTTTTYVKHPGEAGYNEFNNNLTDIIGEYNTYSYVDGYEEYTCLEDDTLKSLASKFNTTVGSLIELNHLTSDKLCAGQVIKYNVKDEYINVKAGTDVTGVAISNGIDTDELLDLNGIPAYNTVIGRDAAIRLHRFVGNENSYQTPLGTANVIYNNRIFGEELEFAHGFAGSSQRLLAKNSSLNGTSNATFYLFDGGDGIIEQNTICFNPKRIGDIDGIPVAFLRTRDDLEELAAAYGIELDDTAIMQWGSTNENNYPIHHTEDGEMFITFDGRTLIGYNLTSGISYDKDAEDNIIDTTKQLIK